MRRLQKWFLRFGILVKKQLTMPSFYITAGLFVLIYVLIGGSVFPSVDQNVIGLAGGGGAETARLMAELADADSIYDFRIYDSADALRLAVEGGRADCGFFFKDEVEQILNREEGAEVPELQGCVDYYYTTSTTKGEAAKESVYAVMLEASSPKILDRMIASGSLFSDTSSALIDEALAERERILAEERLFEVHFEIVNAAAAEPVQTKKTTKESENGKRLFAALIFAAALFFAAVIFRSDERAVCSVLRGERTGYRLAVVLAPLMLLALFIFAAQFFLAPADLPWVLRALVLTVPTALWAVLFTSLFKNETMYLYVSLGVVLVACVVTLTGNELPFLKSVQYLRWIFPIKYFLL